MKNQTENYIILKPISERFNKVANSITDAEIKSLIRQTMAEKIKLAFDFGRVGEIVESYMDEHEEDIKKMVLDAVKDRMNMPSRF